jgi:PAS domain S-box-containing protein
MEDRNSGERISAELAALRQKVAQLEATVSSLRQAEQRIQDQFEAKVRQRTREIEQSRGQMQTILDSMVEGLLITDIETKRFVRVNASLCRMLGYAEEELLAASLKDIHPPAEVPNDLRRFQAAADGRVSLNEDRPVLRKDGSVFYADITGRPILYEGRQCLLALFRDVTERRQAHEEVLRAKREWERTFDSVPDLIAIIDDEHRILRANKAMAAHVGLLPEQCIGLACYRAVHGLDQPPDFCPLVRALADEQPHTAEVRDDRLGGVFLVSATPLCDDAGRMYASVHVARDISERKRAEEALRREYDTVRHLLEASDHERQSIAYEIHDGLAQCLAASIMQFDVFGHLRQTKLQEADKAFEAGMTMLRQGHFDARRLISGVRPPILDEEGILAAVTHLVNEQRRQKGAKIELRSSVEFDRLPPILENTAYRIVQEALANACRHSKSDKIVVDLLQHGNQIRIHVRDRGVGFEIGQRKEGCFGLQGIRERARLLGGRVSIDSALGRGTRVSVVLPIR